MPNFVSVHAVCQHIKTKLDTPRAATYPNKSTSSFHFKSDV